MKFILVDDDPGFLEMLGMVLEQEGHTVRTFTDPEQAYCAIEADPPHCITLDLMMPNLDGTAMLRRLRAEEHMHQVRIAVVSGKRFEFDQRQALKFGADAFLLKTLGLPDLVRKLEMVAQRGLQIRFWGMRGTLPVPGPDTVRYGGNTACVSLTFPNGTHYIFDAGTGIRVLGNALLKAGGRISARLFLSHPHWDHINALPFFVPLYIPGNSIEILGPAQGSIGVEKWVNDQMDGIYFPITSREFGAQVTYRDLGEGTFDFPEAQVSTLYLCHPGYVLGYRVVCGHTTFCYVTDNELFLPGSDSHSEQFSKRLEDFVAGADLLITDTTYSDSEYSGKVGWGHSSVTQVAELAHRAGVKELCLFHHDPAQNDSAIDAKVEAARKVLQQHNSLTRCEAYCEGSTVFLSELDPDSRSS